MAFNDNILGLSTSCKENQETQHARGIYLSLLRSSSLPHTWKRDYLDHDLSIIREHPFLWNTLKCYHDSFSLVDASQSLRIQSILSNLRVHSIKSSAIKDALLLLDAQEKTLDIKLSEMILRHQTAFYPFCMENPSQTLLGLNPSFFASLSTTRKRCSLHTFPHRLHEIISNPEYSDYITWLPHGYAWKIVQRKQFEDVVIPRHFRHGRFTSFMRQVRIKVISSNTINFTQYD
jgi:HSF-type DNA-binding